MKVKEVRLNRFKRFTDLKVTDIPETAKLVLLVGPNGSGKTSVFDAFNWAWKRLKQQTPSERDYYVKQGSLDYIKGEAAWAVIEKRVEIDFQEGFTLPVHLDYVTRKAFYIRSCYRNEADFVTNNLERVSSMLDDNRAPSFLIAPDVRVSDNYRRIACDVIEQVFDSTNDSLTKKQIRERLIGSLKESLNRVFGDLELTHLGKPMDGGTFHFKKGASVDWLYKNLSAGEKAAFDLVLDFTLKKQEFNDTVYCIDEPELHMHTKLQGKILEELYSLLPENSQLWLATHSVGMLKKALDLNSKSPGSVAFLDFDGHDFDSPCVITPTHPDRQFWKKTFSIAIGELSELVAPSLLFCCEGASDEFDAACYRKIFGSNHPQVEFVSVSSSTEVTKHYFLLSSVMRKALSGVKVVPLIDLDDTGPTKVAEYKARGYKVLSRRNIEAYLFDDEVITALCLEEGKARVY